MLPLKKHLRTLERVKNPPENRIEYLRLDKNENIVPFPSSVISDLRKQITADFISSYPDVGPLYNKVAKYLKCSTDNIYITSGSDGAIKSVFEAFIEPKDRVLLISPTYAMFYVYAKMYQANLKEVFYKDDLTLSTDDIIRKIKSIKPKLVCIANPNSPTGTIIEHSELERIIRVAQVQKSVVLIDEAYFYFYSRTAASFIKKHSNLVVTRTFSKALGLASARLGFAIGQEHIIDCLHKTRPMYETNAFAVKFAEIILTNKGIVQSVMKKAQQGKKCLEASLDKLRIPYFRSYANFVLIDVGSKHKARQCSQILKREKILVKAGFNFPPLDRCIRINIGDVGQMKQFMNKFKAKCLRLNA